MTAFASGFEAFDLRSWVVDGLTRHLPEKTTATVSRRRVWPASAGKLKVLVPAAAAIVGMTVFATAYQAASAVSSATGKDARATSRLERSMGSSYISGTDRFTKEAAQIIATLSRGEAPSAPAETLRIAQVAVNRLTANTSESTAWISTLAQQLAKLND